MGKRCVFWWDRGFPLSHYISRNRRRTIPRTFNSNAMDELTIKAVRNHEKKIGAKMIGILYVKLLETTFRIWKEPPILPPPQVRFKLWMKRVKTWMRTAFRN